MNTLVNDVIPIHAKEDLNDPISYIDQGLKNTMMFVQRFQLTRSFFFHHWITRH